MQRPKLIAENLEEASFFTIYDDEDQMLMNQKVKNENAEEQTLERGIIEQSLFERVTFNQSDFYRLEITDSVFVNCDFSNCKMEEAVFYRCEFKNCKMLGANLDGAIFNNVLLEETYLELAAMNKMKFKDVIFKEFNLKDISFEENKIQGTVKFIDCNIDQMSFYDTSLKNIDFSSCHFERIDVEERLIRGLKVNADQAAVLAQLLMGIRVEY